MVPGSYWPMRCRLNWKNCYRPSAVAWMQGDDGPWSRNGYLPERQVQTGIGSVSVSVPKVRDRSGSGIKFNSRVVPPYLRRSKNLNELIPWLYLQGISTGDMQAALTALLGAQAAGLSAGTVSRLKAKWQENYRQWSQRSLRGKRYVCVWADGVYF